MKKILSLVLVLAMLASVTLTFTGCGEEESDALVVYGFSYAGAPDLKDVFEKYQVKWSEKAKEFGIDNIEWQSGNFEMLLNSGNYADVFLRGVFSNNVQVAKYADQGILIDMAPYINELNALKTEADKGTVLLSWHLAKNMIYFC